jgi:hypothetical protein
MRWIAVPTCLALLLAFLVAPFAHVHTGSGSHHDHDHAGLIHAHFYGLPSHSHDGHPHDALGHEPHGLQIVADDDDDDHAAAWSLDTFTLLLTSGLAPFVPSLGGVLLFVPSETFQPVEIVEECGHDPPCVDRSTPRAPPA